MPQFDPNFVAILVAGVAYFVLGWIWYMPLFGEAWMKAQGMTKADMEKGKKDSNMPLMMAVNFVLTLVTAGVLSYVIMAFGVTTLKTGACAGALMWLGFNMTVLATTHMYGGKSKQLFMIDASYQLVGYVLMGVILVAM